MSAKRVFLIGYMGSGKTTLGKKLAEKTGLHFLDMDHFIENRYRKSIPEIFESEGESAFREMERKVLAEISTFENVIVSTGGGLPCFHANMEIMKNSGFTIYLKVSIEELVNRLQVSKNNRPLLKNKDRAEMTRFIKENIEKRNPYYHQADLIFDAEKMLDTYDVEVMTDSLITYIYQNS